MSSTNAVEHLSLSYDPAQHSRAIRLARLSVWDTVGGARLGVALTGGAQIDLDQLRDLVAHRSIPNQQ